LLQNGLVVASLNVLINGIVTIVADEMASFYVREAGIISGTMVILELHTVTIIGSNVV